MKLKCILMSLVVLSMWTPVQANPMVIRWIAGYLLGKAVDNVWETSTGRPDIRLLDSRLKEVETVLGEDFRQPIAWLRKHLPELTSKEEYERYARTAIKTLEEQVATNTEDIRRLEARIARVESDQTTLAADLKNYMNASSEQRKTWVHPETSPADRTVPFDPEDLKRHYLNRERESMEQENQRIIARNPWCYRCHHYHPIDPRGCPIRPGVHKICGTRHWLEEWCPVAKRRIPSPRG